MNIFSRLSQHLLILVLLLGLFACGGGGGGNSDSAENGGGSSGGSTTGGDSTTDIDDITNSPDAYAAPAELSFPELSSPPDTTVSSELVGVLSGEYAASPSGSATYAVPLALPPGTAGVEPKISLNYNSHSQNGLLGVGWSLSGLSTISRCQTTLAQDGYISGVKLESTDRFCLDGQRLVAIDGEYGADGTEYRTEINTFARIISSGQHGSGPASFTVWTKSGDIMEYGVTDDAQIHSQTQEGTLLWMLNRVSDSVGNYFQVEYQTDQASGEYYVNHFAYTGNDAAGLAPYATVNFIYEERPDAIRSYVLGSQMQTTQRLARVETRVDNNLVKQYRLGYQVGNHTSRSLLNSLTECTAGNQCLPPLTFDWQQTLDPGWEDLGDIYNASSGIVDQGGVDRGQRFADVNGDGLVDRVRGETRTKETFLNTGSGWQRNEAYDITCVFARREGTISVPPGCHLVDVNGDGLVDIVNGEKQHVHINTSQSSWDSTGSVWQRATYELPVRTHDNDRKPTGVVFADLNGDGLVDVLYQNDNAWLNTGNGWEPSDNYKSPYSFVQGDGKDMGTRILDINGDGLPDLMRYRTHRKGGEWKGAYLNTGSGWKKADGYTPPFRFSHTGNGRVYPGSESFVRLNNDNLPDLLYYRVVDGKNGESVITRGAYINTGIGWQEAPQFNSPVEIVDNYFDAGVRFIDLNGDGLDDILFGRIDRYGEKVAEWGGAYINTGNGWAPAPEYTPVDELVVIDNDDDIINGDRGKRLIDLDGDGFRDFFYHRSNRYGDDPHKTRERGAYKQKAKFELITAFNTSLGVQTRVEYQPLTGADAAAVYTRHNDGTRPTTDISIPLYVIARDETDNGLGGSVASRYEYEGLKAHTQGRGLLGFKRVNIIDEQTNVVSTMEYAQDFPLTGRPLRSESRLESGQLTATTEWTYQVATDSANDKIQFPSTQQKVETNYLLDNAFAELGTTVSTTENTYDEYGNATEVKVTISGDGREYATTTVSEYENHTDRWHLGRLIRTVVTKTIDDQSDANSVRTSAFAYDTDTGLLISETVEPDQSPSLTLTTRYQHDDFGNVIGTRTEGEGFEPRFASSALDDRGRFPISATNALGHTETYEHEPHFGVQVKMTGPNGLSTQWKLDGLGRVLQEIRADGTHTTTTHNWCNDLCARVGEQLPYYSVTVETSGAVPATTYFDALTREIRTEGVGLNGEIVYADIEFDELGREKRKSLPYFDGETPLYSSSTFDILGRAVSITRPDGLQATTTFAGLTTRTMDTEGREKEEVKNALGQVIEVTDVANTVDAVSIRYEYDTQGELHKTIDSDGNEIIITYDVLGRKIAMDDPDMGQWQYTYNPLGELISQTDAKGQTSTLAYDALGRLTERSEIEGSTRWRYFDLEAPVGSRGKLQREENDQGIAKDYQYDQLGRASQVTETLDGLQYSARTVYDQFGRVARLVYPTSPMHPAGMMVDRHYNERGFLQSISNPYDQTVYWEAQATNANGQVIQAAMGNNVTQVNREYDRARGWLLNTRTNDTLGQAIHAMRYTHDSVGNILTRSNDITQLTETFSYDNLDRVTGGDTPLGDTGFNLQASYAYDALGNITQKSDMGDYQYGTHISNGAGPHAVTQVNGPEGLLTYAYDANGSMTEQRRDGEIVKTVAYTSFGKPYQMTNTLNNASVTFEYGTGQRRVIKRSGDQTTYYIGIGDHGTLFQLEHDNEKTRYRFSIYASGDKPVAEELITHTDNDQSVEMKVNYFHYDHLSSVEVITDELGQVVESRSFDAWGKTRSNDWATSNSSPFDSSSALYNLSGTQGHTTRGFTGHEQIEEVGLIHMNGRVYDPTLGRFLSADPNIQDPGSTQNYNRYTYVQNNPLKYSDPTGYFFENAWQTILQIGGFIVGTAVCGGNPVCGALISAAVSGIITVGSGGSVQDGLTAAAITFGASLAFAAVGDVFTGLAQQGLDMSFLSGGHIAKTLVHGALGGAFSAARGGDFKDGFIGAAAAQFAAPAVDGLGAKGIEGAPPRIIAAAVVGGTISEVTGGKFANGAVMGAFARAHNEENHNKAKKELSLRQRIESSNAKKQFEREYDLYANPKQEMFVPYNSAVEARKRLIFRMKLNREGSVGRGLQIGATFVGGYGAGVEVVQGSLAAYRARYYYYAALGVNAPLLTNPVVQERTLNFITTFVPGTGSSATKEGLVAERLSTHIQNLAVGNKYPAYEWEGRFK